MVAVIAIPARWGSQRVPGKLMADVNGRPLLWYTINNALQVPGAQVVVATDDDRIAQFVSAGFTGVRPIITATHHINGTSRVFEAAAALVGDDTQFDILVNLQGDEPCLSPLHVQDLIQFVRCSNHHIATLAGPATGPEYRSESVVKVALRRDNTAMYFSRAPIPHGAYKHNDDYIALKHAGIYAFRYNAMPHGGPGQDDGFVDCESLEQLRWMWSGYQIAVMVRQFDSVGIDTLAELDEFRGNSES